MRILLSMQAKRLSDNTLDAVSLNCAADLPVYADSKPPLIRKIRITDKCKAITVQTSPLAVNSLKLPPFP